VTSFGFMKTSRPGGFGAVRELCELIADALTIRNQPT